MSDDNPAAENQEDDQKTPEPSSPQPQQIPRDLEFDMFMMYGYRTTYCPPYMMQHFPHNASLCPNVHPGTTRRRDPRMFDYSPDFCQAIPEDCENEERCGFSHNILEHCLHPRKYRKTRCFKGLDCKVFPCLFPHNPVELNRGLNSLKKPPLYPLPPMPPPPVLPLPANLRMPPPGPDQLMVEGPLPKLGKSKRGTELRPPHRYRHRLPPLPKRKKDDEASGSGTKKKDDEKS